MSGSKGPGNSVCSCAGVSEVSPMSLEKTEIAGVRWNYREYRYSVLSIEKRPQGPSSEHHDGAEEDACGDDEHLSTFCSARASVCSI